MKVEFVNHDLKHIPKKNYTFKETSLGQSAPIS